jgi:hypothetical protein
VPYAERTSAETRGPRETQPMRIRRHDHYRAIDDLRLAIDCLPIRTREAMLEALNTNDRIIVGAYVDGHGGVCPMLGAHRCGGRTDFISFAKSWDRFTRASAPGRPATPRELEILTGQLQASLSNEARVDFNEAIIDHRKLRARGERARAADPVGEIQVRRKNLSGWLSRRMSSAAARR